MAEDRSTSLRFPDVPKLELDQLIDQLVDRAQGVKRAQGRLRALLHAIETVTGDLSLEAVLRNIVGAACELAGARYGALGVIGDDGGLEQFIHVGIDDRTATRIGHLPQGKGLLGALITDPHPIRLEHMADDERSTGFPPEHPPMDTFLGVPIHVRNEVFGNLYLAECRQGRFSAEDEELVIALALAAGTAIRNARLYDESRLQQRWLSASVEIGSQLLAATGEEPLQMIARRAIDIADADIVSVGLIAPDGQSMVVEVALGDGGDQLIGQRVPLVSTLVGTVVEEGRPLILVAGQDQQGPSHLESVLEAGPLMVLPLQGTQQVRGLLSLARRRGRRPFAASDLTMAASFAAHASIALELADSRAAEQKLVLLEDHDRIARDLHDHVIQELFAIGLGLESAAALLGPDNVAGQRIQSRVDDIDRTIRRIRTSIFELRGPLHLSGAGLRQTVLTIASELTPALGFPASVSFAGLVDLAVGTGIADDLQACVREALTNVAKHAGASRAEVDLSVTSSTVVLTVSDNGVGIGSSTRSSGLANLRSRAERRAGSFDVSPGTVGGTTMTWKVPIT